MQFTWLFCLASYNFLMYFSPKVAAATQVSTFLLLPGMIPNILAQYWVFFLLFNSVIKVLQSLYVS